MVRFNMENTITPCQGIGKGGFCRQTYLTPPTTHKSTFGRRKRISCPPRTDRECPRPKMNYHYRYYSFAEVLHFRTKTKTEILYTSLRLIESDLPDFITPLLFARDQGREANVGGEEFVEAGGECLVHLVVVLTYSLPKSVSVFYYQKWICEW